MEHACGGDISRTGDRFLFSKCRLRIETVANDEWLSSPDDPNCAGELKNEVEAVAQQPAGVFKTTCFAVYLNSKVHLYLTQTCVKA